MSTLSVWRFEEPDGAERAVATLKDLSTRKLITVMDAATVVWPENAKKPKTRQLNDLAGRGALGGAFWGMLFGLLFFVPLLGLAIGAAAGALAGRFSDVGISDEFINRARDRITPGTSALFVLTSDAVVDRVKQEFEGQKMELLFTNLSTEQEQKLRETFADDDELVAS